MMHPIANMEEPVAKSPRPTNGQWNDAPAPKDGSEIVAVGRILWEDEACLIATRFVGAVMWKRNDSGYVGWHYADTGMTVARMLGDNVRVDFWMWMPQAGTEVGHV